MLSSILQHLIPDPPKKDNLKVDESKYWSDWAGKADTFYPMIRQLIDSFDLKKDDTKNWNHFEACWYIIKLEYDFYIAVFSISFLLKRFLSILAFSIR